MLSEIRKNTNYAFLRHFFGWLYFLNLAFLLLFILAMFLGTGEPYSVLVLTALAVPMWVLITTALYKFALVFIDVADVVIQIKADGVRISNTVDIGSAIPKPQKPLILNLATDSQKYMPKPLVDRPYFYSANDKDHGPFSAQEIKELITSGKLDENTLVFKQGETEWKRLFKHPELAT